MLFSAFILSQNILKPIMIINTDKPWNNMMILKLSSVDKRNSEMNEGKGKKKGRSVASMALPGKRN
jgi:hypothetical protein